MPVSRRGFLASAAATASSVVASAPSESAPRLTLRGKEVDRGAATRRNAWLEVDVRQFDANLRALARRLGDTQAVCVVVKADAYGHGLDLLMPSILRRKVSCLGVASNDEAHVARSSGFRGRLLRLRIATADEAEDGLRYAIEEMIGGLDVAESIDRIGTRRRVRVPVHIAINSMGMSREGLDLRIESNRAEVRRMLAMRHILPLGIMDHCPVNTVDEHRAGASRFRDDVNWLLAETGLERRSVSLHCANSFAALNVPENRFDLVRVGRALYGHGGATHPEFRFCTTFKSRVVSVGRYPAGATVSYERAYTLKRETRLANIPVGFSDGYRRAFSRTDRPEDSGRSPAVLIGGRRAPIVGFVTMNILLADVTDFQEPVTLGDEVVLYGRQGDDAITLDEMMSLARTNPPDLYTPWGNSLPKIPV